MGYDIKQTAQRLKELREIYDYSAAQAAEKLGVSPDEYSRIESAESEISVGFLYEAANLYQVELTEILTGNSPKLRVFSVVRDGEGLKVDRGEKYKHQSLAYNFVGKKTEPFLVTLAPEKDGAPMPENSHPGQEMNYVIEGTVKIKIDQHEVILNAGDTIYFDASYPHGMQAMYQKPAKFIAVIIH